MVYFLAQIQFTGRYDHQSESDFVFLLCRKCQNAELFEIQFVNLSPRSACNFGETWLRMREAISVSCQAVTWFG